MTEEELKAHEKDMKRRYEATFTVEEVIALGVIVCLLSALIYYL